MSLNILNSNKKIINSVNKKSSRKAKILPQFSISSETKPLLDLLEIQRKSFFDFLQHGIPDELAKTAVFRETAKNSTCKQELELKFNPETYKFISPNFTPKEAILNGKTYACKVYVQATLLIRSPYNTEKANLFSVFQKEPSKGLVKRESNLNFDLCEAILTYQRSSTKMNSKALLAQRGRGILTPLLRRTSLLAERGRGEMNVVLKGSKNTPLGLQSSSCASTSKEGLVLLYSTKMNSEALEGVSNSWLKGKESVAKKQGPTELKVRLSRAKHSFYSYKVRSSGPNASLDLHVRVAKAHLRQCWIPLSKTLLSKNSYYSTKMNPIGVSTAIHVRSNPLPLRGINATLVSNTLLKNDESNILERTLGEKANKFLKLQKNVNIQELATTSQPTVTQSAVTNPRFVQQGKPFNGSTKLAVLKLNKTKLLQCNSKVLQGGDNKKLGGDKKEGDLSASCLLAQRCLLLSSKMKKPVRLASRSRQGGSEATASNIEDVKALRCKEQIEDVKDIQVFRPWIFLGELPLMTKRGHFILNGSPRVIVNQIARCPGIYFQEKRRGVGIEQEIRVSADLIPQRGPWLRIQSDWEGRFWARLKQEGRVKYATLYEAFQEFEKEYNPPLICLLANSYSTNINSSLFSKSENVTFQERKIKEDRQKKALIRLFKNPARYSLGKLGRFRVNERIHHNFTRPSEANNTTSINYVDNSLTNRKNVLEIMYASCPDPSYLDLVKLNSPLLLSSEMKKPYGVSLRYPSSACTDASASFNPTGLAKQIEDVKALRGIASLLVRNEASELRGGKMQSNATLVRSSINPLLLTSEALLAQRRKALHSKASGSVSKELRYFFNEELMAKDLDATHTCLERLLEGQGFTDDIDNLKNRFIRTSGKLLQQQFELGLFRLNEVIMPLLGNLLPSTSDSLPRKALTPTTSFTSETLIPRQRCASKGLAKQSIGGKALLCGSKKFNYANKELRVTEVKTLLAKRQKSIVPYQRRVKGVSSAPYVSLRYPSASCLLAQRCYPLPVRGINATLVRACCTNPYRVHFSGVIAERSGLANLRNRGLLLAKSWKSQKQRITGDEAEKLNSQERYLPLLASQPAVTNRRFVQQGKPYGVNPTDPASDASLPLYPYGAFTSSLPLQRLASTYPYGVSEAGGDKFLKMNVRSSASLVAELKSKEGLLLAQGGVASLLLSSKMKKPYLLRTANGQKQGELSKEISLIKNAPFRWLRTSKPINSAFREFFGSNPLSQYMDQTNPLAEITHKRRLSSMGPGGIKRETAGMEVRGIHPTHYGRVCPIETPEGKNAGLVNSPTVYGRVSNYGFLETPLYEVIENQVQTKRWAFFSAQHEEKEKSSLATCDTGLLQFNFLAHVPIPVQTANNPLTHFQQVERYRVGYRALSPIQTISIATALIPFLEHDDANRALMGSNMQRQAIPLLSPERPIVGTGFEPLVVIESGQALQATKLGCVSEADANSIIVHTRYSMNKPLVQVKQNVLQNLTLPWSRALVHRFGTKDIVDSENLPFLSSITNDLLAQRCNPVGVRGNTFISPLTSLVSAQPAITDPFPCKAELCKEFSSASKVQQGKPLYPYGAFTPPYKQSLHPSFAIAGSSACTDASASNIEDVKALLASLLLSSKMKKPYGFALLYKSLICNSWLNGHNATFISPLLALHGQLVRSKKGSGQNLREYNREHISSSHNTFLLQPLKQDLQFYERSNQETCLNQRPLVQEGDWIQKGDFLADSSASHSGDLALGKNVTVAYMPWEGYNFEDAIVISDRLVSDDIYTSLHIERYEIKVSKNSQGKERITNRVPGTSHSLKHLDNFGIARISSWVQPGDILVGKVVELKRPLSPYERLAWELASRLSPKSPEREKWLNKVWLEDISLRLPSGVCGRVINSQIISTEYASMSDLPQRAFTTSEASLPHRACKAEGYESPSQLRKASPGGVQLRYPSIVKGLQSKGTAQAIYPQEVHVYLAIKRKIQIGDKLAGRHGNKGIVSAILPQEDMPYLGNGSCIDMVLNPLGVPSRMNLGQIFECLLGLAGSQLGCNFRITPFDEIAGGEASRSLVFLKLYQCRLMYKQQWLFTPTFPGKSKLFDGRTGEPFENWVTVGQAYMLKLIHMVDHKIHARSTGPYSLFTRQPVRGRSRRGGQRLGEMEVWAVEGFGAAYTLQEFLTIKSDDLKARTALQKGFYKQNDVTFGKIHIAPGNPEAFKVLISELQALCLHIQM